jgi:hypothetical protein
MGTIHTFEKKSQKDFGALVRRALIAQRALEASATISDRLADVAGELRRAAPLHEATGGLLLRLAGDFDRFAHEGGSR